MFESKSNLKKKSEKFHQSCLFAAVLKLSIKFSHGYQCSKAMRRLSEITALYLICYTLLHFVFIPIHMFRLIAWYFIHSPNLICKTGANNNNYKIHRIRSNIHDHAGFFFLQTHTPFRFLFVFHISNSFWYAKQAFCKKSGEEIDEAVRSTTVFVQRE